MTTAAVPDTLADWAPEILDDIRKILAMVLGEEAMKATPPMFYPEALRAALRKAAFGTMPEEAYPEGSLLHQLRTSQARWETLRKQLLRYQWQRECVLVLNYRAPYAQPNAPTRVVVFHPPTDHYLRHSGGPQTGSFWDIYGDDFLTEELALVELSKAPAPTARVILQ